MKPLEFYIWENIARCMKRVAHRIWDEQVAAVSAGHPYSEETITERVAALLAQAVVAESGVHVRTFTKHEEGNKKTGNGADLAIWVQLPTGTYGFHFQAKSRVVDGLFKSFKPSGKQHQQLLIAAQRENANPSYLFYPAPVEDAGSHHPDRDVRDFGCSATVAYASGGAFVPASAHFASLAALWAPWHVFALATTWIGDGKSPTWWHPEVAAPSALPVRAVGLPLYLEDAAGRDRRYSDPDVGVTEKAPRPQRTVVIEGRG